jgi:hypothetical protein
MEQLAALLGLPTYLVWGLAAWAAAVLFGLAAFCD